MRIKIVFALILAFIFSSALSKNIFLHPLKPVFDASYLLLSTKRVYDSLTQKKQGPDSQPVMQITPAISPQRPDDNLAFTTAGPLPSPTRKLLPTVTNIPKPTRTPTPKGDPVTYGGDDDENINSEFICPATSSEKYDSISIISTKTSNPQTHPDINLHIRGYTITDAKKELIDIPGDTDVLAPQLTTLLSNARFPKIVNTYKVYDWDWSKNKKAGLLNKWEITLIGLASKIGQKIMLPNSGYNIGGGYQAMVLYAETNNITLKYTREDNVIAGYTLHLDDICVDTNLLAKYKELNGKGRVYLPAVRGGQKIGLAKETEVKVAIRDTGEFMDPRVKKDWWVR